NGPRTIRVLDDKEYREHLTIQAPIAQRGITLEAVRGAVLVAHGRDGASALIVAGVQNVTLRGFRLRADAKRVALVLVRGRSARLTLEDLTLEPGDVTYSGVECLETDIPDDQAPIVIQRCTFSRPATAIFIAGLSTSTFKETKAAGVVVRNNRINAPSYGIG